MQTGNIFAAPAALKATWGYRGPVDNVAWELGYYMQIFLCCSESHRVEMFLMSMLSQRQTVMRT